MEFMHLQCSSTFKMTRCSMFCLSFILNDVKLLLYSVDLFKSQKSEFVKWSNLISPIKESNLNL